MKDIEYILDFAVEIGKDLISSGANIERANLTIEKLCHHYKLKDVCMKIMSTSIELAAHDQEGNYCQREIYIPYIGIDMDKLKKYNNLSYYICSNNIAPKDLMGEIRKLTFNSYPWYLVLIGYIIAMATLVRIFGGGWQDLLVTELNTCILFGLSKLFAKIHINKIITNAVSMFICSAIAMFFVYIGFGQNFYTIIITNAFYLIPGVPMVNAVKNILCANEINGIIDLIKVILEIVAIVGGLAGAYYCFGTGLKSTLEESIVVNSGVLYIIELIVLSFFCSLGFSIVFNIRGKDLILAGIGGTIIRIVLIIGQNMTSYRLGYTMLAAFAAALFSEIVAIKLKQPSTYYLYPSIVPIIPGDLFYYSMLGIIWTDSTLFNDYFPELVISLVSISLGFVICSTVVHYARKIKFRKLRLKTK